MNQTQTITQISNFCISQSWQQEVQVVLLKKEETIPTSNHQKQVRVIQTFKLM